MSRNSVQSEDIITEGLVGSVSLLVKSLTQLDGRSSESCERAGGHSDAA